MDVEQPQEVGERLGGPLVRRREYEVEVRFVVDLALSRVLVAVRLTLLKDAFYEDTGQTAATIARELLRREHPVLILVELEIVRVQRLGVREAEPVVAQLVGRDVRTLELEQLMRDG